MPKLLNKLGRNKQKTQFLTVYRRFQKGMERGVWSVGRGAWSVGRGAWGVERGAWSVGCGAWGVPLPLQRGGRGLLKLLC